MGVSFFADKIFKLIGSYRVREEGEILKEYSLRSFEYRFSRRVPRALGENKFTVTERDEGEAVRVIARKEEHIDNDMRRDAGHGVLDLGYDFAKWVRRKENDEGKRFKGDNIKVHSRSPPFNFLLEEEDAFTVGGGFNDFVESGRRFGRRRVDDFDSGIIEAGNRELECARAGFGDRGDFSGSEIIYDGIFRRRDD